MNKLAKKTNDEDDEDVAEENYFDETATLATRVRDYVLNNLAKREVK